MKRGVGSARPAHEPDRCVKLRQPRGLVGSRTTRCSLDRGRGVGADRRRPARSNDHIIDDVADDNDELVAHASAATQALAIRAASATLLRTAQMFASRLAPPEAL